MYLVSERVKSSTLGKTIGFRLGSAEEGLLLERARKLGVSASILARSYVLDQLSANEERAALRDAVLLLESRIQSLRGDLGISVQTLLSFAGRVLEKDAENWVKENLKD